MLIKIKFFLLCCMLCMLPGICVTESFDFNRYCNDYEIEYMNYLNNNVSLLQNQLLNNEKNSRENPDNIYIFDYLKGAYFQIVCARDFYLAGLKEKYLFLEEGNLK